MAWHETLIWQEHRCQDIYYQVFTIWISSRGVLFTKTCFCVFETDINHRISIKELKSQPFPSSKTWIHESIHHGMKPWFGKNIYAMISPIKFSQFGSRARGFYSQKHVFVFLRLILTIESASKNWRVKHFRLQKHVFMNLSIYTIMAMKMTLTSTLKNW